MSEQQSPSSIPPRRARYGAVTALIAAVATLIGAIATRIVLQPEPVQPPRVTAEPPKDQRLPEIPKELDSTPADRFVRDRAAAELRDVDARLVALETLVCALKQNTRALEAQHVRAAGGKRGLQARDEFLAATAAWMECPAVKAGDKPQQLPALPEKADSALRR